MPAKLDDGTPVYINLFSQKAFKYESGKQIQVDLPDIGHRFQGLIEAMSEAIANHTASVCINTCYVKQAVEYMAGRIPVCCVVGLDVYKRQAGGGPQDHAEQESAGPLLCR